MQVPNPAGAQEAEPLPAFNGMATRVIDEFFADIDDKVTNAAGDTEVFGDADRAKLVTAVGGLLAFSSDYTNFEAINVPIMNLFPDMFGPHKDNSPASAE